MDAKNALFLPPGSVRALGFLILIITACYLCGRSMNIPSDLWDIIHLIVGFYFGTKAVQPKPKE